MKSKSLKKFKELKNLNLLDDFLFKELAEDQEAIESILEIILGREIELLEKPKTEKEERTNPFLKRVKLDVYAFDDESTYDVEVQQEMKNDLRKRIRFYTALMDYQLLKSGSPSYNEMKDVYLIMIAPFDLFGDNRYKYTFKMTSQENKEIELGDGQTVIFLNTNGKNEEGASQELIDMLKYFQKTSDNTENKSKSNKIEMLHEKVRKIKSNEKVGVKYMNRWEEEFELREEGRAEGRAEGRKEGRKEGAREREFEIARNLKQAGLELKMIAKNTGLTLKEVEEL